VLETPGGLGALGALGGNGAVAEGMPGSLKLSPFAPQFEHSIAVGGFSVPHFKQVISVSIVTGLKHIEFPF